MEPEMHCSPKVAETSSFLLQKKKKKKTSENKSTPPQQTQWLNYKMQLLIKYMHFVPERLKCCAWFTGLTVLINLSVLNKRGLVFILGSVSRCYEGSGFRGVWTKLRGWCSLDLLSVVRSPFCRHTKKKKKIPHDNPHRLMQWDTGY